MLVTLSQFVVLIRLVMLVISLGMLLISLGLVLVDANKAWLQARGSEGDVEEVASQASILPDHGSGGSGVVLRLGGGAGRQCDITSSLLPVEGLVLGDDSLLHAVLEHGHQQLEETTAKHEDATVSSVPWMSRVSGLRTW